MNMILHFMLFPTKLCNSKQTGFVEMKQQSAINLNLRQQTF